ncbi:hypothetical protein LWF01_02915 [Saxibacter everestensis]|uniref:Terminase n=1 Tax=Saxibacter everestensis TaxID=2909229 RepID=A0ABY8QX54_9MICO|nr:hypothetical protein LWF01_02915 [Brevibacteriaceae bacterium ZFBP1038]
MPLWHTTAADDAVDLAAVAGLVLDPWQEYVLRGALGERKDGKWSAFRTCLVVPRQNGKNAILEARELAGSLLFGEELIVHTAHQYRTAHKSMLALMKRIKQVPALAEYVVGYDGPGQSIRDIDGFKTGNNPGIYLTNGNSIEYATRSGDAGRGFTGNLVVLDEAYAVKSGEIGALLPTLSSTSMQGNPQVWFTSSAGKIGSDYLATLRDQGRAGLSERLAYFEWSADEDATIGDVDAWYEANPALGYRISEEYVQDELDSLMDVAGGEDEFKRERLGIWEKLGGEPLFPRWHDCRDGDLHELLKSGGTADQGLTDIAFAVDVPPDRSTASIGVAGFRADGSLYMELVDRGDGTAWVAPRLREILDARGRVPVFLVGDSAAAALDRDFRKHRVRVLSVNNRVYGQACAELFDLIDAGHVAHAGQTELDDAVEAAKKSMMSDTLWRLARKNPVTDISPLVAVTLAVHGAQKRRPTEQKKKRRGSVFA